MNMNEDLATIAALSKKIQGDLHELQHIHVDRYDQEKLQFIKKSFLDLTEDVYEFAQTILNKYKDEIPPQKPIEQSPFIPLPPSSEYLIRMRKFDDNNSTDHFADEHTE